MKTNLALFLLGVSLAAPLRAQAPVAVQYGPGSLDQLVAPIALYPDPLIALILPASTAPADVVLAARYIEQNGAPALIDAQPWDPSVKALAHYPDIVTWMDANLAWTQALGQAFASQPDAVMQAVQIMRARAQAAGSLQSTPQQQVVLTGGVIEIIPAQPNVIYVPCYDWAMVYETGPGWRYPLVTFGLAFPVGPWLSFSCDWREHRIRPGAWARGWDHGRDGRAPVAGHFGPPPAVRRSPGPPRSDARPGQWQRPPGFTNVPAPNHQTRRPGMALPSTRSPLTNLGGWSNQRPNPRRDVVSVTPRAPSSTRSSMTNFGGWGNQRPAPRRDAVYGAPSAPAPRRAPSAAPDQTDGYRNSSDRSQGGQPAIAPAPRPSVQHTASPPAPQTQSTDTRRRPDDRGSR